MHRSIKQHMVRYAKFTCFSKKKRKNKKKHTQQQQQTPKNPKTKHKKNPGAYNKRNRIRIWTGCSTSPNKTTYSYFCSLGSFIGEKKSIKKKYNKTVLRWSKWIEFRAIKLTDNWMIMVKHFVLICFFPSNRLHTLIHFRTLNHLYTTHWTT